MSGRRREALEIQLLLLEQLYLETLGDEDPPQVCVRCYELEDDCICIERILWPLSLAIRKLRREL